MLSDKTSKSLSVICLLTHLSHPKGDFINLVDGHKRLHIVKQENIVKNGGKEGQRAVEHRGRDDALPAAPDTPAHSSFSISALRLVSAPSCNHLTAWPIQGHHLVMACKSQSTWRIHWDWTETFLRLFSLQQTNKHKEHRIECHVTFFWKYLKLLQRQRLKVNQDNKHSCLRLHAEISYRQYTK